ncbi:MAG: hypothetical protein ACJAY8_000013 [Sphingobacteriales bacterium]
MVNNFPGGNQQGSYLFTDEDGETGTVFLSAIQIRNYTLSNSKVHILGGPKSDGFQNINTGVFNLESPTYPNSNFVIDPANNTIYMRNATVPNPDIQLQFSLAHGATANINNNESLNIADKN